MGDLNDGEHNGSRKQSLGNGCANEGKETSFFCYVSMDRRHLYHDVLIS